MDEFEISRRVDDLVEVGSRTAIEAGASPLAMVEAYRDSTPVGMLATSDLLTLRGFLSVARDGWLANHVLVALPMPAKSGHVEWCCADVRKGRDTEVRVPHFDVGRMEVVPTGLETLCPKRYSDYMGVALLGWDPGPTTPISELLQMPPSRSWAPEAAAAWAEQDAVVLDRISNVDGALGCLYADEGSVRAAVLSRRFGHLRRAQHPGSAAYDV